jgi:hypothetical protein
MSSIIFPFATEGILSALDLTWRGSLSLSLGVRKCFFSVAGTQQSFGRIYVGVRICCANLQFRVGFNQAAARDVRCCGFGPALYALLVRVFV